MEMVVQKAEGHNTNRPPFLQTVEVAHGDTVHPGDEFLLVREQEVGGEALAKTSGPFKRRKKPSFDKLSAIKVVEMGIAFKRNITEV